MHCTLFTVIYLPSYSANHSIYSTLSLTLLTLSILYPIYHTLNSLSS
nr:MAG TPA: hypothetical protein [Bacteriophage sp.]